MPCKGICSDFAVKISRLKGGLYETGYKRCTGCDIFIKFDGKNCPCCGCMLRGKPRNSKGRKNLYSDKLNL